MVPTDKAIAKALYGAPVLVVSTVALMEELAAVMMKEIDLIKKRMLDKHAELLKQKQKLAINYGANMTALKDKSSILKGLSNEAKEAVREMSKRLAEAVEANARALRATVNATRQLIQNVISMVKSEALPAKSYRNFAKSHMQLGTYSPTCEPIAIVRNV